ncbi:MAG: FtsX-like permease family protein [Desulfofustis sp.]
MSSVRFVQKLALSISLVILVTASAMVGLSMLSAVNERKKDIGILRSLGYGKTRVFMIFCLEAGIIGLLAGAIGYLAGYGISLKALEYLSLTEVARPLFSVTQLAFCALVFPLITILAALYPAWKGSSIEPSQALVSL